MLLMPIGRVLLRSWFAHSFLRLNTSVFSRLSLSLITLALFSSSVSFATTADESPQMFTYQGRLLDSTGATGLTGTVDFVFQIWGGTAGPNECLLYEEAQTAINLTPTSGVFSVKIGESNLAPVKRAVVVAGATLGDPGLQYAKVFQNNGTVIRGVGANCPLGYTGAVGDARRLRVIVVQAAVPTTLTPDQSISSVPFALQAEALSGFGYTDFLQTSLSGQANTTNVSQVNMEHLLSGSVDINATVAGSHTHDGRYLVKGTDTLAGDVTGLYSATSVVKIQGKTLNASLSGLTAADDGKVLTYTNATGWAAAAAAAGGITSVTSAGGGGAHSGAGQTLDTVYDAAQTKPNFVGAANTHNLRFPLASDGAGVTAGLLSNAQYTTLNGKVGGSGTQYFVPLWNNAGGTSLGNSLIQQDAAGTKVGIGGGTASAEIVQVTGNTLITGTLKVTGGIDANSQNIINVLDPVAAQDAMTKAYGTATYFAKADHVQLAASKKLTPSNNITNATEAAFVGTFAGADAGTIWYNSNAVPGTLKFWDGATAQTLLTSAAAGAYVLKAGDTMTGPLVNNSNAASAAIAASQANAAGYAATFMGTGGGTSGYVGIGTLTPAYKLDVVGDLHIDDASVFRGRSLQSGGNLAIGAGAGAGSIDFTANNGTPVANFGSTAATFSLPVVITGANTLTVGGNAILGDATGTARDHTAYGDMYVKKDGSNGATVFYASGRTGGAYEGNVGIGTATPGKPLDVTGEARFSGAVTMPNWTTGGRPGTPALGMTGFNTTLGYLETYTGGAWVDMGAAAGGGITTIDGSTGTSLTVTDDTNVTVTGGAGNLTMGWTGQLDLSRGGTNKNMVPVNGGVVWTDADSQEVSAAGTAGQILKSNAAAAPTWVDVSSVATTGSGTQYTLPMWNNAGGTILGDSVLKQATGGLNMTMGATGTSAFKITGIAAQTANFVEIYDSTPTLLYSIEKTGTPTAATDLINKGYGDTTYAAIGSLANYVKKDGTIAMTGGLVHATWATGGRPVCNAGAAGTTGFNTTTGYLETCTGAGWVDYSAGAVGGGITDIDGSTGTTLTVTDDTNVTVTGGAGNLTMGWTGVLSTARGGNNINLGATGADGGMMYRASNTAAGVTAAGVAGQILTSGGAGAPAWVTVVPLANGGTNKALTAVNGGVVWTDADSQEVSAAGTAGQVLKSNGAAAPTWVDPNTTLTAGNLTETGSNILTVTGGTGAVLGTGTTILVKQAATAQDGFLSSTDWNSFNTKVDRIGDTMTGTLNINVPTTTKEAVILKSTDDNATKFLFKTLAADGTTVKASLRADGVPTNATDLVTKNYADTKLIGATLPAAPTVGEDGKALTWSNGTSAWVYTALSSGSVTSVTASAPLASSGGATPDISLTGIVPLANGGTNKAMGAVNGGVVWTDADSQEVSAAGTAGQILKSNAAAAPTWVDVSSVATTGSGTQYTLPMWNNAGGTILGDSVLKQATGGLNMTMGATGTSAFKITGIAAQTANFVEIYDSTPTLLYSIEKTGTPTAATDLINKGYGDTTYAPASGGAYVAKAGDTMTGPLVNNSNAVSAALAVSQANVAGYAATFMGTGGGTSGNVGIGTTTPTGKLDVEGGTVYLPAQNAAPADGNFANSQYSIWLDETNDEFEFKAKKADGTVISRTLAAATGDDLGNHTATQALDMAGFTVSGGSLSGGNLALESTSHATKGAVQVAAGNNLTLAAGAGQLSIAGYTGTTYAADFVSSSTTGANSTLRISQSGATGGTDYGIIVNNTGAGTTNVGASFSATGATNNYGIVVPAGNVGVGTASPNAPLDVISTAATQFETGYDSTHYFSIATNSSGVTTLDTFGAAGYSININDGISIAANNGARLAAGTGRFEHLGYSGTTNAVDITSTSTSANNAGISVSQTGATVGTDYGTYVTNTGAGTTNVGGYFSASGGTNNYGLVVAAGNVGVGTTSPDTQLHVNGAPNGNVEIKSLNTNAVGVSSVAIVRAKADNGEAMLLAHGSGRTLTRYGITVAGYSELFQTTGSGLLIGSNIDRPIVFGNNDLERMRIAAGGKVGIGTSVPAAKLSVTTDTSESAGASMSSVFRAEGGVLSNVATSEISLGTFVYRDTNNWMGLGVHAYRTGAGPAYTSTAVGISMDVDNTTRAGAALWLHANGAVGIGTTTPDNSSILDISSTSKGVVLPRMTKAQRNAIATPIAGMMVYQTDNTPGLRVYNGTNWMRFTETID